MLEKLNTERPDPSTEQLDMYSAYEIAKLLNEAEKTVPLAIEPALPKIALAIDEIVTRLQSGGRLLYFGAGTSGRLGILDAAECPPTFGTSPELVQSAIAGGMGAAFTAVEHAEDDEGAAQIEFQVRNLTPRDAVVGLSASGRTPYVIGGLRYAKQLGALTVAVSCNSGSRMSVEADIAIEVDTGPEVLMGSTRLKAGSAQKIVLNMLSTGAMVKLGKVYKNLMVDLKASNHKLHERSRRIVMLATGLSEQEAETALHAANGHVKLAILMVQRQIPFHEAEQRLSKSAGDLRQALAQGIEQA